MKYIIDRSPTSSLWLDTHAVTSIGYSLFKKLDQRDKEDNKNIETYELIKKLAKDKKIICFESDQLREIEVREELTENAKTVLSQISLGLKTHYQFPRYFQLQIGMKAKINSEDEVNIAWPTAFHNDPFSGRTVGGFIVRADIPSTREAISEAKNTNIAIASEWENLRQELLRTGLPEKSRFEQQRRDELFSERKMFIQLLSESTANQIVGKMPTTDEIFRDLEILGTPLSFWEHFGGKGGYKGVIDFYGSEYFLKLPYFEIRSEMYAIKLSGSETIKQGDVMDVNNISAFLPYSTYMVLDKAMIDKVNKYGLAERYDTKAVRLSELYGLLEKINDGRI